METPVIAFMGDVINCVNYGTVRKEGICANLYIGGIGGYFYEDGKYKYIQNCANHGTLYVSGTTTNVYLGGIAGYSYYSQIQNCVVTGSYSVSGTLKGSKYNGGIVGSVGSYTYIDYCHWTSDMGSKANGAGTPSRTTGTSTFSINSASVASLNNQSSINGWNKWALNSKKNTIWFEINNNKGFSLSSQLILFPDPAGYSLEFDGWYTDSEYTALFNSSSISNSMTLHGLYGVIVTRSFDGNGANVTAPPKKVSVNGYYGDLPTPSKEGHTFDGWYTELTGGSLVESTSLVSNTTDHKLYAHWTAIKYKISFVPNGGSACTDIVQDYGTDLVLPESNRTGYTFAAWCSDEELATEYTTTKVEGRNITLYARWDANIYTVSFDTKGGAEVAPMNVTFDQEYGQLPEPSKEGCRFLWWEMEDTKENVEDDTIVKTPNNHRLCAVWSINTVTFDVAGGEEVDPINATYNEKYGDLPSPTKTGYRFVGWFLSEPSDEPVTSETTVATPYPHTLHARWEINKYSVVFEYGNGREPTEETLEYNATITYPEDPERRGYSFAGWDKTITSVPGYNVTITAQWTANTYTVTFDVNGGDKLSENEITVTFGETYESHPTPTRRGHTFLCWVTDKNETITKETVVNVTSDHTLYAQWEVNTYTVTFDVN